MCVPCHVFTMNNNVIPSILSYYSLSIYNINLQFDSKNMIKCFSCVSQANPYFQLTSTLMGQNLQLVAKVRPVPLFTSSGTEPALGFFLRGFIEILCIFLKCCTWIGLLISGEDSGKVMIWNMAPVLREEDEKNENIPKMLCQMDNHLGNQPHL